jgi:hypothetical protein
MGMALIFDSTLFEVRWQRLTRQAQRRREIKAIFFFAPLRLCVGYSANFATSFLAIHDPKLSVLGQKLSVAIQINQSVTLFLFLILKRSLKTPPPERAQNAGDGGEGIRRRIQFGGSLQIKCHSLA